MTRVPIAHRRPRTLLERTQARLHAIRHEAGKHWRKLRHRRRHRAAHARMQKLFLQLQHRPHPRTLAVVERGRHPHLRHAKE